MRTLDERQKKLLRIYDNLRQDAKTFTPTATEPENLARKLYDDFMQNDEFKEGLRSIAVDFGRGDMLAAIDTYQPSGAPMGIAGSLVAAVNRGDDDMLVDLVKKPEVPTYSLTELNTFWNVAANIQQQDPQLYTHLVADKRYVDIFDQTAAANEYAPEGIAKLREDVVKAHEDANKTLDSIGFDKFQMQYTGMSDNIYDLLENSDFETIGPNLTADAPKTVFSGLKVAAPLPAAELTAVSVPVDDYYEAIQKAKEPEIKPDTPEAPPSLAGQFNAKAAEAAPPPAITTPEPAKNEPEPKAEEEDRKYKVKNGDSLWKIAKEQYGLKSYKDIMRAVEHIAAKNDLDHGVKANHIATGRELSLPSKEDITTPVKKLDWAALEADTARHKQTKTMALAH